ncbi:hypothetical protein MOD91_18330 [Bacillus haynesii]|uniref:hypothetical protein n=1 Tax=Bacillus haynesii TaxID=1925021 RepID=UPI002281F9A1|nr:hypothetical protein [Bacillus haynesii]MCY8048481.1 hypothetical protein [Bacillus haynesii]MCY8668819.1 hypothetical protein [Bacillus haynesii]MCY9324042.1 hypothetical protein [Bacillus haynesii]
MGAVGVDIHAKERVLNVMFPIDTEGGVSKLMYALPYIKESRYYEGDYGACDLIMDLETALENIKLTDSQKRIIELHYGEDLTQTETVRRMAEEGFEITQQGVSDNLKTISRRISKFHGEGLIVE